LGFGSAAVLASVLGLYGAGPTAFALANTLPTYIYAIVAGGLLSAVLVPHIVRAATAVDGGQGFVNRLVTLGVVAFLGTATIATLAAPLLVRLYSLGGDERALAGGGLELAIALAYWSLPQIFFYAVYALLGEVLSARGVFGPAAWAPVLNNVVMIAGLLMFAAIYGVAPAHADPARWDAGQVMLLAGSATLGVAVQAIVLTFFWRRTGLSFRPDFHWRRGGLGAPARAAGWVFGMVLVVQVTNFVQTNVATTASDGDATLPVLRTTWLIFMLSHSIIAISIATPYFTRMAAAVRDSDIPTLRADLSASLRLIGMLVAGAGAALAAAALPFAAFFDPKSPSVIAIVLLGFLVGLVPFSTLYLVLRAFYALGDTRTPFLLQVVQAAIFIAGTLALLLAPSEWIAAGIALVTSISVIVQAVIASLILRKRLGGGGKTLVRRFGIFALATIPAAAVGVAVLAALGGFQESGFAIAGRWEGFVTTVIVGGSGILTFLLMLIVTRAPELSGAIGVLKRWPPRR
jgi:putative peptidoglycan lipid II flippase